METGRATENATVIEHTCSRPDVRCPRTTSSPHHQLSTLLLLRTSAIQLCSCMKPPSCKMLSALWTANATFLSTTWSNQHNKLRSSSITQGITASLVTRWLLKAFLRYDEIRR